MRPKTTKLPTRRQKKPNSCTCKRIIGIPQSALRCVTCNKWSHKVCSGLSRCDYDRRAKEKNYKCEGCSTYDRKMTDRNIPKTISSVEKEAVRPSNQKKESANESGIRIMQWNCNGYKTSERPK